MEPRRGADSRLAPKAKAASGGGILALAAAALIAVSGCGGEDSDPEAASAPSPPAQQAGATGATGASAPASSKKAAAEPKGSGQSASQGSGAKQGQDPSSVPVPSEKGRERAPTPQEEAEATVADMTLRSPALTASGTALPAQYTCDGKDTWPPLQWGGAPAGTEELILFAMSSQPVGGKLFFNWAVAGIDPDLTEIEEGRLPQGAISGRNSFGNLGYSVCPAQGEAETFIFALFALPQRLSPAKGFDPAQLRREVLDVSGNVGLLAASYAR